MQVVKAVETSRPADLYGHIHVLVSMGFCCNEKIYTTSCDMEPMIKAKQKKKNMRKKHILSIRALLLGA